MQALRLAIAGADALLIATPEYNGSIPGQLKNAFDWASRPYGDAVQLRDPELARGLSDLLGDLQRALNPVHEAV